MTRNEKIAAGLAFAYLFALGYGLTKRISLLENQMVFTRAYIDADWQEQVDEEFVEIVAEHFGEDLS